MSDLQVIQSSSQANSNVNPNPTFVGINGEVFI